jgi:hypothetical protein
MENCRTKRIGQNALALLIAGAVVMTAPISAWAKHLGGTTGHAPGYTATGVKAEDVRNTLHNLSTTNPIGTINVGAGSSSTTEVCVFCHTPHGASTTNAGAAPLWNRAMPSTAAYSTYSGPNMDGTTVAPVGVFLACLSCHDGTVALDALRNAPGSGGFRSDGSRANLVGAAGLIDGAGVMKGTDRGTETNYATLTGGTPFPNLTQDLSDDHPISFAMPSTDPQFDDALASLSSQGNLNLVGRAGLNIPTDKRDAIRLYPPNGAATGSAATSKWVECASCHNPHAPRPLFLRLPLSAVAYTAKGGGTLTVGDVLNGSPSGGLIADDPNAGSAVCLSCHEK